MVLFKKFKKFILDRVDVFLVTLSIFTLLFSYHYQIMEPYENLVLDSLRNNFKDKSNISKDIIYLVTDQYSLQEAEKFYKMGWPWKRSSYSKMIDFIGKSNGSVIAFDAIFTEKSIYTYLNIPDDSIFSESLKNNNVILANFFSLEEKVFYEKIKNQAIRIKSKYENILKKKLKTKYSEKDLIKKLEQIINKANSSNIKISSIEECLSYFEKIIQSRQLKKVESYKNYLFPFSIKVKSENPDNVIKKYYEVQLPLKDYISSLRNIGNVYGNIDADGVTRRNPIVIRFHDLYFPSLSFSAYLIHKKIKEIEIGKDYIKARDLKIPLSQNGQFLIKYYEESSKYPQISQVDMLLSYDLLEFMYEEYIKNYKKFSYHEKIQKNDIYQNLNDFLKVKNLLLSINPKILDKYSHHESKLYAISPWSLSNKMFIVADAIPGHHDIRPTPIQSEELGAHIHGSIINNLINKDVSKEIRYVPSIYISLIFFPVFIFLTIRNLSLVYSFFVTFSFIIISIGVLLYSFINLNLNIDILTLIMSVGIIFIIVTLLNYIKESQQKQYIESAFSQYLSPKVIQAIIKDPSQLNLGGTSKELSVFFSDIEGFSSISEQLSPKQIIQVLNIYLTEMCNIIIHYDGVIDKFIGDAVVAFWGAPLEQLDHAKRVCYSAIDMQKKLNEIQSEFSVFNFGKLAMRIGINSGESVVGNMGSIQRTDYTVIGDVVNTASRLEGANKFYGTYTCISSNTYSFVKDFVDVRELDTILVVGKKIPVKIYELIDKKNKTPEPLASALNDYNKALFLYQDKNFKDSITLFDKVLKVFPKDKPSMIYKERSLEYMKNPPRNENWLWSQLTSK